MEAKITELGLHHLSTPVTGYISPSATPTELHRLSPVCAPLQERWLFGRLVPIGQGHSLAPQRSRGPPHTQTA